MTSVVRGARILGLLLLMVIAGAPLAAQEGTAPAKSLYERLGGLAPISVVVNDFIDALVPDPVLNQNPAIAEARARVPASYLKFHVTTLVCQATGGPCQYVGRSMKESHSHLNISQAEWDRMASIFKQVLDQYKVPEKEQQELFAVVGSTQGDIVMKKM